MANHSKHLLIVASILASSLTFATSKTFLGPIAHFGVTKSITDDSAFSLAGEAGPKNYRASGTVGWEFDYHQRMKATAEYLRQKINYSFYDGAQDIWMGQGAVGLDYQYDFRQVDPFNTLLDLSAYYSYSPSKNLGVNSLNSNKRVAGANAYGFGPGLSIVTLEGTAATLELDYDNVHYNTDYRPGLVVKGLGGTFRVSQELTEDVTIGASAAVRKPFNNYEANITFANIDYYGSWAFSGFGAYTVGKSNMPSTYNVGLGADYFPEVNNNAQPPVPKAKHPMPQTGKNYKDYKDMPMMVWEEPDVVNKDLLNWVKVPAVRMPQVLGVPDENICVAPTVQTIPDQSLTGPSPWEIDVSPYFTGSNLNYSLNIVSAPDPGVTVAMAGSTVTVDSSGPPVVATISVTASNACGSVTSNDIYVTD